MNDGDTDGNLNVRFEKRTKPPFGTAGPQFGRRAQPGRSGNSAFS